jgi:hypothetical protein
MISIDIISLYQQAFGTYSNPFEGAFTEVIGSQEGDLNRVETGMLGTDYYAVGHLGKEYYMPAFVEYVDATSEVTTLVTGNVSKMATMELPYPVLSITNRVNLVETPLTQRKGSVIEVVGMANYMIRVRGFLISKTNEYPEKLQKKIMELWTADKSNMRLRCAMTDHFLAANDFSVTLVNIDLPDLQGVKHVQPYELQFISNPLIDLNEI